ncbi:hypothetical protein FACS1894147_03150 [Spirochaetia bacterium]|nr:hypothetical protein FACS1894147_03150 [Spirochaetia bacterium]
MEFLIFLLVCAFLFAVIGVVALIGKTSSLTRRIKRLEDTVQYLEKLVTGVKSTETPTKYAAGTGHPVPETPVPEIPSKIPVTQPEEPAAPTAAPESAIPESTIIEGIADTVEAEVPAAPPAEASEAATTPESPARVEEEAPPVQPLPKLPPTPEPVPSALWTSLTAFIKGGNLWAAGGIALLVIAFGLLITYLALHGFFTVEMGIAAAAVTGLVMLVAGWRFRLKRPVYFLLLQGGGIGILYLSVFAAHKLTPYFPPLVSLILLSVLIPPALILAIFQKSQPLAFCGFLGGFAAPLLIAIGADSHVFLFAYYGVLSLGVLGIGFFRCWRGLNLLSFLCTFTAALVWMGTSYTAPLFWSAEPFFVGYILLFTVLGLLGFRTGKREGYPAFDGVLVIGTPLIGAVLQWQIFSAVPHGLAFASVAFSAYYLAVTLIVLKCRNSEENAAMNSFAEAYLALSVLLANLAIPLELAPRITSAVWATEGVLIFFAGRRQGKIRVTAAGLIVHAAAAIAFAVEGNFPAGAMFRSPQFIGSLVIAFSALAIYIIAQKTKKKGESFDLPLCIAIWGYAWWFGSWIYESYRVTHLFAGFLVIALSALAIYIIARKLKKTGISPVFLWFVPFWAYGWWFAAWITESYQVDYFHGEPGWFLFLICSVTALLALALSKKLRSFPLRIGVLPVLGFAVVRMFWMLGLSLGKSGISGLGVNPQLLFSHNFLAGPWVWSWLAFIAVSAAVLFFSRTDTPESIRGTYLFTVILTLVGVFSASGRAFAASLALGETWISYAGLLPLFALMLAVSILAKSAFARTLGMIHRTLILFVLPLIMCIILGFWFVVTLFLSGDPSPLPLYIPLLNPLDLEEGFCIVLFILWQRSLAKDAGFPSMTMRFLLITADSALFCFLTAIVARSLHFYGAIPYSRIVDSEVFHLCLFILWALYGIAHIIVGSKKMSRGVWIAGAVLIVADIAKLLILDMADSGAIPRIVSFFIAGLVLLFIGWIAPLPPAPVKGKAVSVASEEFNRKGDEGDKGEDEQ